MCTVWCYSVYGSSVWHLCVCMCVLICMQCMWVYGKIYFRPCDTYTASVRYFRFRHLTLAIRTIIIATITPLRLVKWISSSRDSNVFVFVGGSNSFVAGDWRMHATASWINQQFIVSMQRHNKCLHEHMYEHDMAQQKSEVRSRSRRAPWARMGIHIYLHHKSIRLRTDEQNIYKHLYVWVSTMHGTFNYG